MILGSAQALLEMNRSGLEAVWNAGLDEVASLQRHEHRPKHQEITGVWAVP